ncbi:MAG: CRISPR-associated protein [Phormidesmis priestleyi]|uniref:CRISPR-associated protein n=1 Tax=Phormidesmis priestleyi TaxID=268141 RepID=A0A2W4WC09_9CYAN|nr:MAG: CRISPR-associated protein [Phormidesmis priestleyi]
MKRNPIIEILADPTKSFLANFVLGTLVFTLVSDGLSDLFWDGLNSWAKTQLWMSEGLFRFSVSFGLILLVLAVIYLTNFTRWVRSQLTNIGWIAGPITTSNVFPLERAYPGLIVLMSPKMQDSPAEIAIRHHLQNNTLKVCWIICTHQSREAARAMVDRLKRSGAEAVRFYYDSDPIEDVELRDRSLSLLVPDNQVDDPNHIRKLVEGIYADVRRIGLDESEVIADYTGGTKGMTAGLLLACTKPERPLQYLSQVNYPQIMAVQVAYRLKQRQQANP